MTGTIRTKQGAASIYIVVFTILLFSAITVAFAFLISSESGKTQNDTLSQAAYDASLAGIEDAKLAVIKYRNCLDGIGDNCEDVKNLFEEGMADRDCDMVANILGRNNGEGGEVYISETTTGGQSAMDQAYTCVTMSSVLSDYRATISSTTTSKVIPLQVAEGKWPDGTSITIDSVKYIKISWFNREELGAASAAYTDVSDSGQFSFIAADDPEKGIIAPPVLSVSYVQFPYTGIAIGEDSVGNDDTNEYEMSNRGQIWLVPVKNDEREEEGYNDCTVASLGENKCYIDRGKKHGDSYNPFAYSNFHKDDLYNTPYAVECELDRDDDFLCSASVELPKAYPAKGIASIDDIISTPTERLNGYSYLVVSLPYNQPNSSFKIEMYDENNRIINFGEVQIAIDSTGRASDVYSRTEVRIEMSDVNFPYPYYAVQAFGNNKDNLAIGKNFWAAKNCWYTEGSAVHSCDGNVITP